jgi:hypothetical protein
VDEETMIGRRRLLLGAGVGVGTLALTSLPATASAATNGNDQGNNEGNNEGLTGAWFVTALVNPSPPNPPATVVVSFAGGGVYNDMLLNPLGVVSPALGTWELTGDHAFKVTAWSTANLTPTLTVATRSHVQGTFGDDDIQATLSVRVLQTLGSHDNAAPTSSPNGHWQFLGYTHNCLARTVASRVGPPQGADSDQCHVTRM